MAFSKCKVIHGNATGICYQPGNESIVEGSMKQMHRGYISDLCVILILLFGCALMVAAMVLTTMAKYWEAFSINIGIFVICLILGFSIKRDISFNTQIKTTVSNVPFDDKTITDAHLNRLTNELNNVILRNQGSMDVTWTNEEMQKELDNQIKLYE